ncbi:MAG: Nickel uptake substrate-specific transmembrane region [Methanosaeta sp. PtaB.Bin039]|nr:MAG: Nickel uptake substrate-specific transmembrane region [Methanosaeta sp. PtaB.Bin039]
MSLKLLVSAMVFLIVLCFASVNAHESFVRPISGWAEVGDTAILPIGSGHTTESSELPLGLAYIKVISQSGHVLNHTLSQKTTTNGYWMIYDFDVDGPGLNIIDLYHTEGSWTHFITNPPAGGFWEHKSAEEINWTELDTTTWADDWYVEKSYPKHCYAKAFVAGPESDFSLASRAIGQKLEIVPLDNITTVGQGEFSLQVLFDDEPYKNVTVTAQRVGDDTELQATTDSEGKVRFNLSGPSEVIEWLIKTNTGMDPQVVELVDLPRGKDSKEKSYVGPVYRTILALRNDYIKAE